MWIYYCIIGLICIDFLLEYWLRKKNVLTDEKNVSKVKKFLNFIFKYRVITILSLVLVSTLKAYTVGADTKIYERYWNALKNNEEKLFIAGINVQIEFLYTIFNSLLIVLGLSFRFSIFIISLFVSISIVVFVNKVSTNKFMSLILYVALGIFAQSLNLYRQIIAMVFVLFAIMCLIDKKWIKATMLILVGTFFHMSCLMCLLFVIFRFIKPKWWIIVGAFTLATVGAFALPQVLKVLENLFGINYYTKYFVEITEYRNPSNLINTLYSIGIICVFAVMYVARFKVLKLDQKDKQIYDFFLLIFMIVPLVRIVGYIMEMPELLNRLSMYPFMILLVLIPLFVKGLKHNTKLYAFANVGVYLISAVYMYYLYAVELSCKVVPYAFCF